MTKYVKAKINWIGFGEGYWSSAEGRFDIAPLYNHSTTPSGYSISDRMSGTAYLDGKLVQTSTKTSYERVRDCKEWAQHRVQRELDKHLEEIGRPNEAA